MKIINCIKNLIEKINGSKEKTKIKELASKIDELNSKINELQQKLALTNKVQNTIIDDYNTTNISHLFDSDAHYERFISDHRGGRQCNSPTCGWC
jgi:hypothetical protein